MNHKKTIAIFFGGNSPEHDVSILTALQIIEAIDSQNYDIIPIYIDKEGIWWSGDELLERKNYHFNQETKQKLHKVFLKIGENKQAYIFFSKKSILHQKKPLKFDIAFPAFHGGAGENGFFQGLCESANIAYVGPRAYCANIWMNKAASKKIYSDKLIKTLPDLIITKVNETKTNILKKLLQEAKLTYPLCAKPANLGSSIAVYKAHNISELQTAILAILKIDNQAIIEPFIENLVEYNIAVTRAINNEITLSAIESPITDSDYLSFQDKYLNSDNIDNKLSVSFSEGMASASRNLNPKLKPEQRKIIEETAKKAFLLSNGTGAPRIDFLVNSKTNEIWLNEINAIAGSLGYYLWEAKKEKSVSFTELLNYLINEALTEYQKNNINYQDLASFGAAIFPSH